MKIKQLHVLEFGCIKDKIIEPDGALNIIYGENESGKSTLLLFIKFMLYGLTRRSASNSERDRSVSWSGHRAAGSMTIFHGGKEYRIERSFNESGRGGSEKLSVVCLDNSEQIAIEKSPGEYFLGVPREVFESTACVGQMRSADINGDKLAYGIENMLSSADETVDTAKILKSLDSVRVSYRHKNKNGGSLYEQEREMLSLRQRVDSAREASQRLGDIERTLEAEKKSYAVAKADFEKKDALLGELNKVSTLKRFDALKQKVDEKRELEKKIEQSEKQMQKNGFLPDRTHTAEIKLTARAYSEAEKNYIAKEMASRSNGELNYDVDAATLGEKLENAGGKGAVLFAIEEKRAKVRAAKICGAVLLFVGALAAIAGGVLVALGFVWGAAAFAALPVCAVVTVLSFKKVAQKNREAENIASEYGASLDNISQRLDTYVSALATCRRYRDAQAKLGAELFEAERAYNEKKRALYAILEKTVDSPVADVESAAAEFKRIESFLAAREKDLQEAEALEKMIKAESELLGHYDEQALRAEVTVDVSEITPKMISVAESERNFLANRTRALYNSISLLEKDEITCRAKAEDPLPLADALAELEQKHKSDGDFYNALTLAMESIEAASNSLRGNMTPVISQKAGEMLEKLSGGKYSVLRTNSALSLSLDKDGYGIKSDSLSAGTKDAAYLALRLSLFMRIFGSELPPLVLDESLCQLDEKRTENMLKLLGGLADEGVQTLLFTSHKREEHLCRENGVRYNRISL